MKSVFVHFLGAAGTVTGSKYLLDTGNTKFLVDCGMFQGLKELRKHNWDYLPVDVSKIDFVLLTHGHLDHVGYLPRLLYQGFKGKIYGTSPTLEIASIVLKDSAKIQEEEAERANKEGYSKHHPAKPLYTLEDVEKIISRFVPIEINKWINLNNIQIRFQPNGHIIGSCFIEIKIGEKWFVFSGDVGRKNDPLMHAPQKPEKADVLFVESTYGDKLHPSEDAKLRLKEILMSTIEKGGSLIIPSFAVERTQLIMYYFWQLRKEQSIPDMPFIIDTPMGADVLSVFRSFPNWHKLNLNECTEMCKMFRIVDDIKETYQIVHTQFPKVVIAGSGMISGGRVLTYLQHYLSKPQHTLLLVGFQAEGTRGRKILDGAHEVKIYGKYYPVRMKVEYINSLSAHADQSELLDWLDQIMLSPEKVYIVHGEKQAAETFLVKLKDVYGWKATVPSLYQIDEIKVNS
ncbi:MAG: MBL fold hydrolase [Bacteroidia bacterium]|nr:MAG: MBL fold hydrolase [Bacteroidia bacterium]